MKKILIVLFLMVASSFVKAQGPVWNNKMESAIDISEKTKKPLMLFFTGSDWCGWCMRLQNEVFKQPEFASWAKKNVVLVELDFPRFTPLSPELQTQNSQLQQLFAITGFPTVWFVNARKDEGKINLDKLGSTGYVAGGPGPWLNAANGILNNK